MNSASRLVCSLISMFSPSAFILPNWLEGLANNLGLPWSTLSILSSGTYAVRNFFWIIILGALSLWLPNWAKHFERLVPSWQLAIVLSFMAFMTLGWLDKPQAFLYFQF